MTTTRRRPKLSRRAVSILAWVAAYCDRHGYSPTVRELCHAFDMRSPNAGQEHLHRLVDRGLVTLVPGSIRTARVTPAGRAAVEASREVAADQTAG